MGVWLSFYGASLTSKDQSWNGFILLLSAKRVVFAIIATDPSSVRMSFGIVHLLHDPFA
jgi:hypothetical protein